MAKRPSKVTTGAVIFITDREHDWGLAVCRNSRDRLSDEEFIAINRLCMAYGNNEGLDRDFYDTAMDAMRRVRAELERT